MEPAADIGRLNVLLELFSECAEITSIEELLRVVGGRLRWIIPFERCSVVLEGGRGRSAWSMVSTEEGLRPIDWTELQSIAPGQLEILERVLKSAAVAIDGRPVTTLCLPLSGRAGRGALCLSGSRSYTHRDLRIAHHAVQHVGSVRDRIHVEQGEGQRRLVESLFTATPAAIVVMRHPELVIEFANPLAASTWYRSVDDIVGKPLLAALPELVGYGFDEQAREVMGTGRVSEREEIPITLVVKGAERTLFLNFVFSPVRGGSGEVDGVAAFAFDVTAQVVGRRRAELAARVGRAFVSTAPLAEQLTACCQALAASDAAVARIWTCNDSHEILELRASAGIAGSPVASDARIALDAPGIGALARSRRPWFQHGTIDTDLADPAWLEREGLRAFAGFPLIVADRLIGVMALFGRQAFSAETLASLGSVADQVAVAIDRDTSERFRELFLAMLGHDLRNPLNAVVMASHILRSTSLDERQQRVVGRIETSATRMSRMIGQVLDFTRARVVGGIPLVRSALELREVVSNVVAELDSMPNTNIEAVYRGEGLGWWDGDRLGQVFSNLIGNAVSYGRSGSPVRVVFEDRHDEVVFTVHNLGPAIPEDQLPSLFDPFRRALYGKDANTRGLGLGLFISRQIVVAHGGSLTVTSSPDEGTTFTVVLPRTSGPT